MRAGFVALLALAFPFAGGSACAMKSAEQHPLPCRVVGGEKLPAASGGAGALCAAIEKALAAKLPGQSLSVEVRVLQPWQLSAAIETADGRSLPEQNFAISDRELTALSFEEFAANIARAAAEAPR